MPSTPKNWHDRYFREVLGRTAYAASELRAVVPKDIAARVDWTRLQLQPGSIVSRELQEHHTDLVFRTRLDGHEAFVFVLVEHQSRAHKLMAFRMLEYVVCLWRRHLDEHPEATRLPPVIPLVVHTDPDGRRWNAATEIGDLIDADPGTRTALGPYTPRMRFLLDDVAAIDPAALMRRPVHPTVRVMLVLQRITRGNKNLHHDWLMLEDDLAQLLAGPDGAREFDTALTYIVNAGDINTERLRPMVDRLGPAAKEAMMTTAERLRDQGRAETLLEQLEVKFTEVPQEAIDTVKTASPQQLSVWTRRILTASTLAEALAP